MSECPRCLFPNRSGRFGHCKKVVARFKSYRVFRCMRKEPAINRPSLAGSSSVPRIGESECPNIHAATRHGHFQQDFEDGNVDYYSWEDRGDYLVSEEDSEVIDYYFDGEEGDLVEKLLNFWVVDTPEELQRALLSGTKHVVIVAHLDATGLPPAEELDGLHAQKNDVVVRVSPSTLTVAGRCRTPPPESFGLTEPVPEGACAILIRKDFLDAPLGTTCLLLDSLYVAVQQPGPPQGPGHSSVLILHVSGAMWITNSVFQGAGPSSRAIGMNTRNEADKTPELFIQSATLSTARHAGLALTAINDLIFIDGQKICPRPPHVKLCNVSTSPYSCSGTTFTGFSRMHGPGIRMLQKSRLWLDNVTFKDMAIVPQDRRLQHVARNVGGGRALPVGTAIVGYSEILVNTLNLKVVNNTVLGQPAGSRVVAISPNGTEVLAFPRMDVWLWPDWDEYLVPDDPVGRSDPDVQFAADEIIGRLRPEIRQILAIQNEIADEGLAEAGFQIKLMQP